MTKPYLYEGQVRLEMQEGGFAYHAVELTDRPDPEQPEVSLSVWPVDLASELERHFAAEFNEGHGTEADLGRLRITVEAVES